ncbi:MAG TPA: hypothetical protein VFX98_19045 [Longimicrobiaceae bacterium]|nr:hypothetical protein [Longimicrobiaceae bacterium]
MSGSWKPAVLALALAALARCRETRGNDPRAAVPAARTAPAAADTGAEQVSGLLRDPRLAGVLAATRGPGLAAALDSLERAAARDPEVRMLSHQVAHALGRWAALRAGSRPDVYRDCTPRFQSGCYHGVLETYLARAPVDDGSVAALCGAITRPDAPRLEYRECAHGLGHGLMARFGHELAPALRACDGLAAEDGRVECWDGVFMENVVHGMGEDGHHAGAGHAPGAAPPRPAFRADDPAFPCDSVAAKYRPSCWHYQHRVVWAFNGGDPAATLRACGRETPAAAACYRGFGKQVASESPTEAEQTVALCRAGRPELAGWCVAGAAEFYVDLSWTTDPAHTFCARVPAELKPACYGMIGSRLPLMHTTPEPIRADCRRAGEAPWIRACLEGAGLERS